MNYGAYVIEKCLKAQNAICWESIKTNFKIGIYFSALKMLLIDSKFDGYEDQQQTEIASYLDLSNFMSFPSVHNKDDKYLFIQLSGKIHLMHNNALTKLSDIGEQLTKDQIIQFIFITQNDPHKYIKLVTEEYYFVRQQTHLVVKIVDHCASVENVDPSFFPYYHQITSQFIEDFNYYRNALK